MAAERAMPEQQRLVIVVARLMAVVLVGIILTWGKAILIPLALAVLLTFLLHPMVRRLDHAGFGRVPPVILAVMLVGVLLGGLLWLFVGQLQSLAYELPSFRQNITTKLDSLQRSGEGGAIHRIQQTVLQISRDLSDKRIASGLPGDEVAVAPIPVTIVTPMGPDRILTDLGSVLGGIAPALEVLATGGLTLILVIFMLIQFEDLRNRVVSFSSAGGLSTTTKALDDAAHRISRYLLMQLIINSVYGIAVFTGLLLIGVPYAFLWGLFAAVFRYVPYVGPWVAAILPLAVSLMSSPGWGQVWMVAGLFVVLELLSNNFMEPWLYGHGVGISMMALIVSAAFWTLLWGPIGLVLATPLTVCLAVAGKYVPALGFLDRLLGEAPDLEPHVIFLQRLLARDVVEAQSVAKEFQKAHSEAVYDELLVPSLALARRERTDGTMSSTEERFVSKAISDIVGTLPAVDAFTAGERARQEASADDRIGTRPAGAHSAVQLREGQPGPLLVMGCPAHHEIDELSLVMLQHVLQVDSAVMQVISTRVLPTDLIAKVKRERPAVVVVSVMPPSGLEQARYLCRNISKRCGDIPIIVGAWNYQGDLDKLIVRFRSAGAHYVTTTLIGARSHIHSVTQDQLASQRTTAGSSREPSTSTPRTRRTVAASDVVDEELASGPPESA